MTKTWTEMTKDERVEAIRELLSIGMSRAAIAHRLGASRNAITGYIDRYRYIPDRPRAIVSLDLGSSTGYAIGAPGSVPSSGSLRLKSPSDDPGVAFGRLLTFLDGTFRKTRPALVAIERPMHLGGTARAGNSERAVVLAYGLFAVAQAVCHMWTVPVVAEYPATVRKHFLGVGAPRRRKDAKAAVLRRARLLGLIPRDCEDEDRADAAAIFDWAAATHFRARPKELHLFGEGAAA